MIRPARKIPRIKNGLTIFAFAIKPVKKCSIISDIKTITEKYLMINKKNPASFRKFVATEINDRIISESFLQVQQFEQDGFLSQRSSRSAIITENISLKNFTIIFLKILNPGIAKAYTKGIYTT